MDCTQKVFHKESFTNIFGNSLYALAVLKINGNIPEDLYGRWKVEILWDQEKIDEKYFYIGTKSYIAKMQEEEDKMW